ncbi:MAG: FAD:protein FMN transferase, partial [Phycisphaerae bacterium]|nr:FAD:protein FMN transferase [Phycisphaerae bacterium]
MVRTIVRGLTGFGVAASTGLVGCVSPADTQRFEYAQIIMGVETRITLFAPDEPAARAAARVAFTRMNTLDGVLSDWRAGSELNRLCARAGTGPVAVSDDLFAVLEHARRIGRDSSGAFDVTVGPFVELWRAARTQRRLPPADAIAAARDRVGWSLLSLDAEARTVDLAVPGMQLDLGGIGKGFAADAAIAVLEDAGVPRCLVDHGGDIAAGAPPPGRDGWRIGLPGRPEPFVLAHAAIATSGDTEQFVEVDGVRYSHIVDPATGLGLTNRL